MAQKYANTEPSKRVARAVATSNLDGVQIGRWSRLATLAKTPDECCGQ